VVLVETQGEANIGAVARSMTCFGVEDLVLVAPRCRPGAEALRWACQGRPLVERARVVDSLAEALEGVNVAVALTRRAGKRRHRMSSPQALAEEILPRYLPARVALVFGNEESGLANEHLELCTRLVRIPTHPRLGSLNLAHSVTIMLYELLGRGQPAASRAGAALASPQARADMMKELSSTLAALGYPAHRATLGEEMAKLAGILERASLEEWEVRFLLGMFRHLRRRLGQEGAEAKGPEGG
jgi:tRNA/rRNA methyltransferase